MKDFLKMLVASILGVFIAMFFVWILLVAMLVAMLSDLGSGSKTIYSLGDNTVLQINLDGSITDRESKDLMPGLLGGSEKSTGLDDILKAIKTAKENDKITGIFIKIEAMSAGIATLEPIRKALVDFKGSGKFVVTYADYYTQGAYYLSSVADKLIMNPQGMLMFRGMAANMQFNKGLFDKLGIKFEVFRAGTFKSAAESFTETSMSEANREQISSYVNCIWSHLLAGISESRGISVAQLNLYADEYLDYSAPEKTVEYGLIDTLMYAPDVKDYIKKLMDIDELKYATIANINSIPSKRAVASKDKIAVLYAEGTIMQGRSKGLAPLMENMITDYEYVKELGKLKDDKSVKAVVFRINSGGGSAFASENIWRAVTELKKEKPVIVSMGSYAASGGYYIACEADYIVAEPTTLTGSIGVIGLVPEGVELHKKLGLTFDGVKTNKHTDMLAMSGIGTKIKTFDDDERMIFQNYVSRFYDVFLTRCADGRSKTKEEIDAIGQGRVWTGAQALQNGLVDRLGSLDDAIDVAAERAELLNYSVESFPKQKDAFSKLMEELAGANLKASIIRAFLGDDVYKQYVIANKKMSPLDFVQYIIE